MNTKPTIAARQKTAIQQTFVGTTDAARRSNSGRSVGSASSRPRGRRNFGLGNGSDSSRDEMNLAEFPLAVLSSRVNSSVKTLEFSDDLRTPSGEMVQRKWIITGADKFGLPTATDDDVVLGLMRMTMDQGFRDRKIYFTRYELLKTLRWSTEGRSYKRLIKSLDRLSGVRIRSTNSFYDNSTKSYQTCNFGIIDAYEINDERGSAKAGARADLPSSYFVWSEVLFDSFKAGFVKKLDLDFYFTLKSAVSRRLYRYLDKHFYYKSSLELPLMTLAFEKIGLSRSYRYVSSIKQQLEPAARELKEAGFLSDYEFTGKGSLARVRFAARNAQQEAATRSDSPSGEHVGVEAAPRTKQEALSPRAKELMSSLCDRGIVRFQAQRLLLKKSEAELQQVSDIIRYFDFLVQTEDKKISRNPTGFLYRAVESPFKFSVPERFVTGPKAGEASARNTRGRPELKLFKTEKSAPPASPENAGDDDPAYQAYCDSLVEKQAMSLTDDRKATLYQEVERKMSFLRNVISEDRYLEAVNGCFRKELLALASPLSYQAWLHR